jgi:hypothetical protein
LELNLIQSSIYTTLNFLPATNVLEILMFENSEPCNMFKSTSLLNADPQHAIASEIYVFFQCSLGGQRTLSFILFFMRNGTPCYPVF